MKLNDFFNASGGRVTGGAEYQWQCFPNAQMMDASNASGKEVCTCIYDRTTFDVYEVTVAPETLVRTVYKWTDPRFLQGYIIESNTRGIDPHNAYDDVQYTYVSEPDLILGVVHDICNHGGDPMKSVSGWPFPSASDHEHDHRDCSHVIEEADDGEDCGICTDELTDENPGGCCGSCNGGCHTQPEPAPEIVAPAPSPTAYKVKIELCHEFDVDAASMEEAIAKSKYFVKQMKPMPGWPDGLCWMDTYYTKETVARDLVTTSYDE